MRCLPILAQRTVKRIEKGHSRYFRYATEYHHHHQQQQQQHDSRKRTIHSSHCRCHDVMKVSASNGIDFSVTIQNPDAPHKVLCLPGALGTGLSDYEQLLQEGLGKEFGIYALDPRGLGGSSGTRDYPLGFYQLDAIDASQVIEAMGFDKVSVLGWSDGANVAIHLAASNDRVQNLVVWGGNAYTTAEDVEAWESLRDISKWSSHARTQKEALFGNQLQKLNHAATDGWINVYEKANGDACLSVLHKVTCPTLVVHGLQDVICETKHAKYIAKQISDSRLTLFAEGKHNLHQKYATQFHQLVRDFLTEEHCEMNKECIEPAIDDIAYGFMGSKALSVALKLGLFDAIDAISKEDDSLVDGYATLDQIGTRCQEDIPEERLRTLLSACVSLQLIHKRVWKGENVFSLPKASTQQLVKSSNRYWGDYIVGQVDAQFYNRMADLDQTILTGDSKSDGYEAWFEKDSEAAKKYTLAQHNGSLATGFGLHKRLPELSSKYPNLQLLDVGGGSGAFSIATARKIKDSTCVVLDLPNVVKVAEDIISEEDEQVRNRLSTLALSATAPDKWNGIVPDESFHVVLMSYVSGSIPSEALSGLYRNAYSALKPGGMAVIHDFFVDNNGQGPKSAALWALTHVTVNPEGMGLQPGRVTQLLLDQGFVSPQVHDMIPETTQLVVAIKPEQD